MREYVLKGNNFPQMVLMLIKTLKIAEQYTVLITA